MTGNDVNAGIEGIFYDHLVDLDRERKPQPGVKFLPVQGLVLGRL